MTDPQHGPAGTYPKCDKHHVGMTDYCPVCEAQLKDRQIQQLVDVLTEHGYYTRDEVDGLLWGVR